MQYNTTVHPLPTDFVNRLKYILNYFITLFLITRNLSIFTIQIWFSDETLKINFKALIFDWLAIKKKLQRYEVFRIIEKLELCWIIFTKRTKFAKTDSINFASKIREPSGYDRIYHKNCIESAPTVFSK